MWPISNPPKKPNAIIPTPQTADIVSHSERLATHRLFLQAYEQARSVEDALGDMTFSLAVLRGAGVSERDLRLLLAQAMALSREIAARSLDSVQRTVPSETREVPRWDGERRELYVGEQLVKRYRQPAPCQVLVLSSFEELGWPPRIDDPLPMVTGHDQRDRLREVIGHLNSRQQPWLIRFQGDGTGQGVIWDWADRSGNAAAAERRQSGTCRPSRA